jgi:hypothetical protein
MARTGTRNCETMSGWWSLCGFNNSPARSAIRRIIAWALALPVAFILLWSSFAHIDRPYEFLGVVYSYQLTSPWTGKWIGIVLPFVQLVAALAVMSTSWRKAGFLVATIMFAGFLGVQAVTMLRGLDIPCGCFGLSQGHRVGPTTALIAALSCGGSVAGLAVTGSDTIQRTGENGE